MVDKVLLGENNKDIARKINKLIDEVSAGSGGEGAGLLYRHEIRVSNESGNYYKAYAEIVIVSDKSDSFDLSSLFSYLNGKGYIQSGEDIVTIESGVGYPVTGGYIYITTSDSYYSSVVVAKDENVYILATKNSANGTVATNAVVDTISDVFRELSIGETLNELSETHVSMRRRSSAANVDELPNDCLVFGGGKQTIYNGFPAFASKIQLVGVALKAWTGSKMFPWVEDFRIGVGYQPLDVNSNNYVFTAQKTLSYFDWYRSYFSIKVNVSKPMTVTIKNLNMNAHAISWGDPDITNYKIAQSYAPYVESYSHSYTEALGEVTIRIFGVTTIDGNAFKDMTDLIEVDFSHSKIYSIGEGAFSNTGLEKVELPESLKYLGEGNDTIGAFEGCIKLKEVFVTSGATTIGKNCFKGCTALEYINIPNTVNFIRDYTFSGCTALQDIVISDSIVTIGNYVFQDCAALKSVRIGKAIRSMGYGIFDGVPLDMLFMESIMPPSLGDDEGDPIPSTAKISIVYGFGENYKAHKDWSKYASQIYSEVLYMNDDGDVVQR